MDMTLTEMLIRERKMLSYPESKGKSYVEATAQRNINNPESQAKPFIASLDVDMRRDPDGSPTPFLCASLAVAFGFTDESLLEFLLIDKPTLTRKVQAYSTRYWADPEYQMTVKKAFANWRKAKNKWVAQNRSLQAVARQLAAVRKEERQTQIKKQRAEFMRFLNDAKANTKSMPDEIPKAVEKALQAVYSHSLDQILAPSRYGSIVTARFAVEYYLSKVRKMNTVQIGRVMGLDHSSVSVALRKMTQLFETYPKEKAQYDKFVAVINNLEN